VRPLGSPPRALPAAAALFAAACSSVDPRQELEITGLETYWAVDNPKGSTQYIAPVVRFHLRNKGKQPHRSIQATANFRRLGEEGQVWSAAWAQVSPVAGKPLAPGQSALVVLKPDGEGRYYSEGAPESMFAHELFKDVKTEVFVRLGPSGWIRFGEAAVERRIGSKGVQDLGQP
jgi:hypothetical protein